MYSPFPFRPFPLQWTSEILILHQSQSMADSEQWQNNVEKSKDDDILALGADPKEESRLDAIMNTRLIL